ncbi:MAG: uroporphyrinogen-III synthase [Flavobacteriales bacterium]
MTSHKFKILSTKVLKTDQKQLFSTNLEIIDRNFISIEPLDFSFIPKKKDLIVLTSQNAVKAVFKKIPVIENELVCVGEKTAQLIEKLFHKKPKIISTSSKHLAQEIIKMHYSSIVFFSGNLRREELPVFLTSKNINFKEVTVYKTTYQPHILSHHFDGMIFFSPSGVESYLKNNSFSKNTRIFAIGSTTAKFVEQKGSACTISNKSTLESLIQTVNRYFSEKQP